MAANTSRRRAKPFVPHDQRDFERSMANNETLHIRTGSGKTALSGGPGRTLSGSRRSAPRADLDAAARELSKPTTVRVPQVSVPHNHPHPPASRFPRKAAVLIGAGVAGTAGMAYLVRRKGKQTMKKSLVDPFAKAYPVVDPVPGSTVIASLRPTGRNVGQANNLKVVGGRRKVGPEAGFSHYNVTPHGHRQGPFGKGFEPSVARGLKMAAEAKGTMPIRTPAGLKPKGPLDSALSRRDPKVNSKIPDASRRGQRLA